MAPNRVTSNINIENAKIIFRNFKGAERPYNKLGDRNFCVVIEDAELADNLEKDGWRIKRRPPREEGEEEFVFLNVAVSFKNRPPQIMILSGPSRVVLDEESVEMLDYADILNADLIITPYNWSLPDGKSGVKAYLDKAYITIEENPFAEKYGLDGYQTPSPIPYPDADSDEMPF